METVSGSDPPDTLIRGHSIREIANDLGVSKGVILSEIKLGRLRAKRVGRRCLIVLDEQLRLYMNQIDA